jgi:hypothetical protein
MSNYEAFLSRLEKVRKSGQNRWRACCPAHNDRSPSLDIALGNDDRILIDCKAGCKSSDVVSAMGLRWADLFSDSSTYTPRQSLEPEHADYVIAIAESDMAKGKRLSRADIECYKRAKLHVARRGR